MTVRKKKIKTSDITLKEHIDKRNFVKFYRIFNNKAEIISGFLLSFSQNFILLQVDNEFSFDGYSILKKDQIDSLSCKKFESARKKIYEAEGTLDREYGIDK